MTFASRTRVPIDKTINEIKRTVLKYGATSFGSIESPNKASIMFETENRRIRFEVAIPIQPQHGREAWEQQCRSKWRALLLAIKAKLESVESGIETFDSAFLSHIVVANGETVFDCVRQMETNGSLSFHDTKQIADMRN